MVAEDGDDAHEAFMKDLAESEDEAHDSVQLLLEDPDVIVALSKFAKDNSKKDTHVFKVALRACTALWKQLSRNCAQSAQTT